MIVLAACRATGRVPGRKITLRTSMHIPTTRTTLITTKRAKNSTMVQRQNHILPHAPVPMRPQSREVYMMVLIVEPLMPLTKPGRCTWSTGNTNGVWESGWGFSYRLAYVTIMVICTVAVNGLIHVPVSVRDTNSAFSAGTVIITEKQGFLGL